MSFVRAYNPVLHFEDDKGHPLAGGWLYTFIAGTNTPIATAKNESGSSMNPVKIQLDSRGECEAWLDPSIKYKFEVWNSNRTWHQVKDNISAPGVVSMPDTKDVVVEGDEVLTFVAKTEVGGVIKYTVSISSLFAQQVADNTSDIADLKTTTQGQSQAIASLNQTKKDKQNAVTFTGSATKTVKKITQNADGEMTVEFEDIDIPPEVPNVDIVSPNNTITVSSSTNPQTNTKTFEIDVANGGNSCGWFNSSNIDTVGNEENINVDRFRISEGQTIIGNGLEFVPIEGDVESGVQFGKVYANTGIYFISVRLILVWSDNPVNKICNVAGRQFDFSYNHEEKVVTTKLVKFNSRTKMSIDISLESDIPAGLRIYVDRFQVFSIGSGSGSGNTYTAGDGIDITDNVISTDISVISETPTIENIDFGQSFLNLYAVTTDGHQLRTDYIQFKLPDIKAGEGIKFTKVGNETTISMDSEVSDVVETVEKLKQDLDTQITTNFNMPNISQVYDFADPSVSTLANGACMLCQSFTIPINHELRTTTDDSDTPTLLGIYAQQNFAHKIMLALYEYTYAGEGEEHGSSTYVGDTGPVDVVQGVNEFPLKNRNPSITELRSDKVYYATLYLPNAARVNGLLLAGAPNYGNGSIPAEPRLTCAVENITWNGQELDMSDPTTTLNHYQEVVIPGEPVYYQYYIGPWNSGYNERQSAPRFYMQIRNGEYNVPVVPTAPFVDLGDVLPRGTLTQTDIPSFQPSQANSAYRDVTPLMNVTITGFEWIDGMSSAAGWAAPNCVFDSGFSTNLSGVSNTVTDLGQVVSGEYPGYAHRITFTTPLTLTAGTTYRLLCGCTDGSPYFKVWLDPTDVIYFGNNGWYVDISNLTRDDHHAGMYNKLYDNNNNSYVI